MKIGNFEIESPVVLGPMAGVTDAPFRRICRDHFRGLMVSEMISAKAMSFRDRKTLQMLESDSYESPLAVQIFGSDPQVMAEAAEWLNAHPCVLVDINMGCPAPKITGNGEGSSLMKDVKLAARIVEAVAGRSKKPVTVKFRKGWDDASVNAVEFARAMEAAGASAVMIHARTREQFYSGKADWRIIGEIKAAVSIPVVGNGDVFEVEDALRMVRETEVDGVMLARGVQGNPWLLGRVEAALLGEAVPVEPTPAERVETALRHYDLAIAEYGGHLGLLEMRKHAAWYLKGIPGAAKLRALINTETDLGKVRELLMSAAE